MKEKNGLTIAVKAGIITFTLVIVIYIGMSIYYSTRFIIGSYINSIDVSGKTVSEAKDELTKKFQSYKLEIKGKGNTKAEIKGLDIDFKYTFDKDVEGFKDGQSGFEWIKGVFLGDEFFISQELSFDESKLTEELKKIDLNGEGEVIKSQSATFKYENEKFIIKDEVYGNEINNDKLKEEIIKSIKSGKSKLDLEEANCYFEPKYKKESDEAKNVLETLNKYTASKINYTIGDETQVIDRGIVNTWINVNENYEIIFDENKIKEYVNTFAGKYNTVGVNRSFKASSGNTVKVSGGDYGWRVNISGEAKGIIQNIKEGKEINREIEFAQKAFAKGNNDIGKTYVEINLTKQHMWFYKNGSLIAEGDIVTGDKSKKYSTPQGVYRLKYKQKDTVLRGPGYASPVTFWMPFNGGIGIHDASWRSTFGGSIYKNNGSHGCVNSPYNLAKAIFYNIEPNTPIVCYFE